MTLEELMQLMAERGVEVVVIRRDEDRRTGSRWTLAAGLLDGDEPLVNVENVPAIDGAAFAFVRKIDLEVARISQRQAYPLGEAWPEESAPRGTMRGEFVYLGVAYVVRTTDLGLLLRFEDLCDDEWLPRSQVWQGAFVISNAPLDVWARTWLVRKRDSLLELLYQ